MPLTSKICSNIDSDIDLSSSTKYMMSDKTDVDDPIQVCSNNQPHMTQLFQPQKWYCSRTAVGILTYGPNMRICNRLKI